MKTTDIHKLNLPKVNPRLGIPLLNPTRKRTGLFYSHAGPTFGYKFLLQYLTIYGLLMTRNKY